MKIVFLLMALFFFHYVSFSQWANNENPLLIKELRLTKLQQKRIRKINRDAVKEIRVLRQTQSDSNEVETRIAAINGARIKKLRNCLTAQQQFMWRQKIKENKPHRGVTRLPNERAVR